MSLIWFIIAITFEFILVASGYIVSYWKQGGALSAWQFDSSVAGMLLKESYPLLLSGAMIIIYQKIDQVMIRNMIDNKAVGQFAIASAITEYVIFIPNVIAQTITPLLVKLHQRDVAAFNFKKQQFMDLMVWSSVLMAMMISLSAFFIIPLLYGAAYSGAVPVLEIMAWKAVFVALLASSGQIIIIEGIQKYAVFRNIAGCIVSVALNLLLIPRFGIIGSAWATLAAVCFAGYFSHLLIAPYRYLFKLQTSAILSGWRRIVKAGYVRILAT
jgi:O-antigen/teichoic acid export membrane protein